MRQTSPQIRHGLQYISREKQPSMFEILSWKEDNNALDNKNWLIKMKEGYHEGRFTEPKIYEKGEHVHNEPRPQNQERKSTAKHIYTHEIKPGLYYYGQDEKVNKNQKKDDVTNKNKNRVVQKQIKRLNQFDTRQKQQIELRKSNIKSFNAFTRQLPNSAFTTYFGKPAFENYGSGVDTKQMGKHKSHSIMPHAGKNHPQNVQTHEGALKKANVVNLESHVPRMPFQNFHVQQCKVNVNEYYNVEIVKPDLINQARFSRDNNQLKFKDKTPKHNELNQLPKRVYKSPLIISKSSNKKKTHRPKTEEKDNLAFMSRRQHFMKDVEQKKKVQNRLAYKVTQCYPLDYDHDTEASISKKQKWEHVRPAGITYSRSFNCLPINN